MAKSYAVQEIYQKNKTSTRDIEVQEAIMNYISDNAEALSDGILKRIPVLSFGTRERIGRLYRISKPEMDIIKKNKEFKLFKQEGSVTDLKLGLLISYVETGKPIFLNFLAILIYSSLYNKYFKNGCNSAVLKYTIETQDDRTDFKKYEMSLNVVISKKMEVIISHFDKQKYYEKTGKVSDYGLRMMLQAIATRFNAMLRTICSKYMENMKDDNIKIMMQYSKTLDGKEVISPLNVIETVRDKAHDNLRIPSFKALTMSGLNSPSNKAYKDYFMAHYNDNYDDMVQTTNLIINEWLKRNPRMNISDFKNKFTSDMSKARNINHIYEPIDGMYDKYMDPELNRKVGRGNYVKFVFTFLMANIVNSTVEIIKNR